MRANDSFHIAVLPGDGIGPEVMAPALEVLHKVTAAIPNLNLIHRGARRRRSLSRHRHGSSRLDREAVRAGRCCPARACGLPHIRYPDGTEIAPQVELRFIFDLYAGVRPAAWFRRAEPDRRRRPAWHRPRRHPRVDRRPVRLHGQGRGHRRRSTRDSCHQRKTSERLFDFAFRLGARRKARGRQGVVHCVDKATSFAPSRISESCLTSRPKTQWRAASTSISTPARLRCCGVHGTSTSW